MIIIAFNGERYETFCTYKCLYYPKQTYLSKMSNDEKNVYLLK